MPSKPRDYTHVRARTHTLSLEHTVSPASFKCPYSRSIHTQKHGCRAKSGKVRKLFTYKSAVISFLHHLLPEFWPNLEYLTNTNASELYTTSSVQLWKLTYFEWLISELYWVFILGFIQSLDLIFVYTGTSCNTPKPGLMSYTSTLVDDPNRNLRIMFVAKKSGFCSRHVDMVIRFF